MNETEDVQIDFDFHHGGALMKLAGEYPTLPLGILEKVQNALDKNAGTVWINIDFSKRTLAVRDDGDGVEIEEIRRAFSSVGMTIKEPNAEKYGKYGIGFFSYLNNCRKMNFTSTPKSNPRGYRRLTLVTADLAAQKKIPSIAFNPVPAEERLWYGKGDGKVPWRTEILLEGISTDKETSRLTFESLEEQIIDRFGIVMKKRNVVIHMTIRSADGAAVEKRFVARGYGGIPLREEVLADSIGGNVGFRLYAARSTARHEAKGRVVIKEWFDPYRLDMRTFLQTLPEHLKAKIGKEAAEALTSGYFEGEIACERITLDVDRAGFKIDDALAEVCGLISLWYEREGRAIYQTFLEASRSDRYRKLTERTVRNISKLIKDGMLKGIEQVVQRPGRPHPIATPSRKPEELTSFGDLRRKLPDITSCPKGPPPTSGGSGGGGKPPAKGGPATPSTQVPSPPPQMVATPVEEQVEGLPKLSHEVLPGDNLYRLDLEAGVLRLNIRHPWWVVCDEAGITALERFQEAVVVQALLLENTPGNLREQLRLVFNEELRIRAVRESEGYLGERSVSGRQKPRRQKSA
jgi:hypothetical protein